MPHLDKMFGCTASDDAQSFIYMLYLMASLTVEICNVHWKSVLFCKYDNATKLRSLCNFRFKFIGRQWNYQKYFVKIPSHACVLVEQTCIPKFHCKRTQLYAILQENIFGIPFLSYKIKFRISGGSELLLWKLYLMVNNFFTVS